MSHATRIRPYPDRVKVREPVARPLDVVAIELLLSASQAFLMGVLMYLAIGIWDDRGVGLGSVAVILALLGLAVGGAWLYWLFGGVGWPLAAANTPVAMFLGFALVLGLAGDLSLRVEGIPLLLAVLAAVYGIVGGVFIDSPRRWRWDQRQKLRPGTQVPAVSETTRAIANAMPRSLPRREPAPEPSSDLAARIEGSSTSSTSSQPSADDTSTPYIRDDADEDQPTSARATSPDEAAPERGETDEPSAIADEEDEQPVMAGATMPTDRLAGTEPGTDADDADEGDGIELPTAVEPRAQRSPWAWAAPPEWNRDEDDEALRSSSSKRS